MSVARERPQGGGVSLMWTHANRRKGQNPDFIVDVINPYKVSVGDLLYWKIRFHDYPLTARLDVQLFMPRLLTIISCIIDSSDHQPKLFTGSWLGANTVHSVGLKLSAWAYWGGGFRVNSPKWIPSCHKPNAQNTPTINWKSPTCSPRNLSGYVCAWVLDLFRYCATFACVDWYGEHYYRAL